MEQTEKRGPGRPAWKVAQCEVGLFPEDVDRLKRWMTLCGERKKGRAFRRAVLVGMWMHQTRPRVTRSAVTAATWGEPLGPRVGLVLRCDVGLSLRDHLRLKDWLPVVRTEEIGLAHRRAVAVCLLLAETHPEVMSSALLATQGVLE